ncbi:MAG: transposase [Rhodospirillales bacterium]|nr:transposase [Rhodospirillales bacterium]
MPPYIDLAEVRTAQGKLYMLVAIDWTSKFAFVELHREAKQRTAGDFLRHLAPSRDLQDPYRATPGEPARFNANPPRQMAGLQI